MASVHYDEGEVGFEEGMLWLPSHVLYEACGTKVCSHQPKVLNQQRIHQQRHRKSFGESQSQPQYSKSKSTSYQRPKHAIANGGPGMQAIFLGSGNGLCGTGVFLPQRAGTNFQPIKRPACAPVLLPARVVQALNLNVHALGLQISPPPQVQKYYKPRCREAYNNNSTEKKNGQNDSSKQCSFVSQNQTYEEIFLPKEWTY